MHSMQNAFYFSYRSQQRKKKDLSQTSDHDLWETEHYDPNQLLSQLFEAYWGKTRPYDEDKIIKECNVQPVEQPFIKTLEPQEPIVKKPKPAEAHDYIRSGSPRHFFKLTEHRRIPNVYLNKIPKEQIIPPKTVSDGKMKTVDEPNMDIPLDPRYTCTVEMHCSRLSDDEFFEGDEMDRILHSFKDVASYFTKRYHGYNDIYDFIWWREESREVIPKSVIDKCHLLPGEEPLRGLFKIEVKPDTYNRRSTIPIVPTECTLYHFISQPNLRSEPPQLYESKVLSDKSGVDPVELPLKPTKDDPIEGIQRARRYRNLKFPPVKIAYERLTTKVRIDDYDEPLDVLRKELLQALFPVKTG